MMRRFLFVVFCAAAIAPVQGWAEGTPNDPGCKQCPSSAAVQKWFKRCQQATAQAACYCAAATLTQCNIDKGGCGSDIIALKKIVKENSDNAKALGTSCF